MTVVPGTRPAAARATTIVMVVACAMFMENLDSTVIQTALPAMAASFRSSPVDLGFGITAYVMSLAMFIPVSGWIADRFGSRIVFCAAIAVFTLASALCALATSLPGFVAARVLQGAGCCAISTRSASSRPSPW
jgi:MFS family permease